MKYPHTIKYIFLLLSVVSSLRANAQYTTLNAHSHNDYEQRVPFWAAYNARFGSVEADVFAVDGELYVAHYKGGIKKDRTLDALYIEPLALRFKQNRNVVWPHFDGKLQLLIDLKTPPTPTLDLLVAKLSKYPEVFDRSVNPNAVQVIISGDMPKPNDFGKYPAFIKFDGRRDITYSPEQLERVAMYSLTWNTFAKGKTRDALYKEAEEVVKMVHELNKKIRFYAIEDTPEAWQLMIDLGVDFINTDKITELADFLEKK